MDDEPDLTADERYPHRARDAELVEAARGSSADASGNQAFGQLYDLWFDRVYALALRIVGQPDVAAEVAQDAFLSAWRNLGSLEDPRSFGGWLLRIVRNAALNRHEREQRSRPVDDVGITMIEATGASPSNAPAGFGAGTLHAGATAGDDPSVVAERNEMQELVWSAVAALPERDAEVLDLQLRYGMSPAEIGDIIGVNRNAANQLVHRVRGRFEAAVRARVLWRGDRPECDELAALLVASGIDEFGADAVKLTERHAASCDRCAEKRELRLRPAALFASVPVAAAPIVFKQQVAGAMEAAGVPMQGSTFASGASSASAAPAASDGAGGPGDAGGADPGEPPQAPGRRTSRASRRRRVAAMAAVVALVLVAAIVLFAVETHDPPVPEIAGSAETTVGGSLSVPSSEPPSTTAAPATTAATIPDDLVVTTSSTSTSTTPTTAPTQVSVTIGLSSSAVTVDAQRSFAPPRLSWSVTGTGAFSVQVRGPAQDVNGTVPSAAPSGGGSVCPGTIAQGRCYYSSGRPATVDYVITVLGTDGQLLATRTVTLSIT